MRVKCITVGSLSLGLGLTYLDEGAFKFSGLAGLELTESLHYIGDFTFIDNTFDTLRLPNTGSSIAGHEWLLGAAFMTLLGLALVARRHLSAH